MGNKIDNKGAQNSVLTVVSDNQATSVAVQAHDLNASHNDGPIVLRQVEFDAGIKSAQKALVEDQDRLDAIDRNVFEALNQFLRMARQIQVEHQELVQVQSRIKETVDEVWANSMVDKLKPNGLPRELEVVKAIVSNPVAAAALKAAFGLPLALARKSWMGSPGRAAYLYGRSMAGPDSRREVSAPIGARHQAPRSAAPSPLECTLGSCSPPSSLSTTQGTTPLPQDTMSSSISAR